MSPKRLLAATLAFGLIAATATARDLYWRSLEVAARLESDGSLTIRETQDMVFTGDWNGGERIFRLDPGHSIVLTRMVRIDTATGAETVMREGDLDEVDEYRWTARGVLRWRSRRPTDSDFENTELVYRLEYFYRGVLVPQTDGTYRLDHDFAFAERSGPIERFSLKLDLAPGWESMGKLDTVDGMLLVPGRGYVYRARFRWTGPGVPVHAVIPRPSAPWKWPAIGLLWAIFLERAVWFVRRDGSLGRFTRPVDASAIDQAWLDEKVFAVAPETVGAVWDRKIGSAEVAAILARLVQEKKIEARIEKAKGWFGSDNLRLTRLVPLNQMDAPARTLVGALFPTGEQTDMKSLRRHYRKSGFDPVAKIRTTLNSAFAPGTKPSAKPTAFLAFGAVVLGVAAAFVLSGGGTGVAGLFAMTLIGAPFHLFAAPAQRKVGPPILGFVLALAMLGMMSVMLVRIAVQPEVPVVSLVAAAVLGGAFARSMVNRMATRESRESLAQRRDFLSARRYFSIELAKPAPRLQDRWFPWFVGLGLATNVDRWMRSFGGELAATGSAVGSTYTGSGGSAGGPVASTSWTGGGGSFGGAGATAAFVAGATAMGAGVSAPSSSDGSSGGGGGGGSSSGGGGGGGW